MWPEAWEEDFSDTDSENDLSPGSSYSMDFMSSPWRGEAEVVATSLGPLSVTVCGSRSKPALLTYHDVALNHRTCFQNLFLCQQTASILLHNFCIYHIDAPGHEVDAEASPPRCHLAVEDLCEQVVEVMQHFGLQKVVGLGVTAGAYILTLFAMTHPHLIDGLILISPLCKEPSWAEWAHHKVLMNILFFYGFTRYVKESLLQRFFFCQEEKGYQGPGGDIMRAFKKELEDRLPLNVLLYVQAMEERFDLTCDLHTLSCPTLIIVGDKSPFRSEGVHLFKHLRRDIASWVEVEACGSLVTEERPQVMAAPLERFLMGLGFSKSYPLIYYEMRSQVTSPAESPRVTAEDLSPSAMGVFLKPIKTRVQKPRMDEGYRSRRDESESSGSEDTGRRSSRRQMLCKVDEEETAGYKTFNSLIPEREELVE